MKAILLSIKPEYALNVLNGNKTLELRKSVPKGFKGWVYCYVTKAKKYGDIFIKWSDDILKQYKGTRKYQIVEYYACGGDNTLLNGTIPFRFWFDDYNIYLLGDDEVCLYTDVAEYNIMYDDLEKLCLDYREIEKYGKEVDLYAWHIKKLEVFDKPMMLNEFTKNGWTSDKQPCNNIKQCGHCYYDYSENCKACDIDYDGEKCIYQYVTKAPQSWQYVYV